MGRSIVRSFTSLCFVLAIGCGAPAEQSSIIETMPADAPMPTATPAAKKAEAPKDAPVDKQAEQAKKYCEHEVKDSEMTPSEALSKKQINACLVGLRPIVQKDCAKGVEKNIVLKIIVEKTGSVTGAFPIGDNADSPEATCIADKVKTITFPRFIGKNQQVIEKYPFTVKP